MILATGCLASIRLITTGRPKEENQLSHRFHCYNFSMLKSTNQKMSEKNPSQRLLNKVCIVTGSSSGLGRAISLTYAQEGAIVVCVDLRPGARQEIKSEQEIETDVLIRQQGGQSMFIKADVSNAAQIEAMVNATAAQYGRIDV
jgi:hypothetical protein